LSNDLANQSPPPGGDPISRSESYEPSAQLGGDPFVYVAKPRPKFQHVWWKHIALFLLTALTTSAINGYWYSATILAILGAHEMGHYLACRYYRVDATLPYFIPMFLGFWGPQTGTLGAVIRIREPFPNRKVLFDIGIAGPLAGFAVLVPALFIGMHMSRVVEAVPLAFKLGRPLLYQFARWEAFGHIPETHLVSLHPMVFAAWFGMLATSLNLLPFGQLDGGHITYATLGRHSTPVSLVTVGSAVIMTFFSRSWLLMTVLMLVMLFLIGPRHPPVLDEYEPLGAGRYVLAIVALIVLILCFTPFPLQFLGP
jgi:membrane-associated protease RseP (regulator of RpoE activity)